MTMLLSRAQILAAKDIATERVAVPEWGGEVLVRALSGAERDQYEQSVVTGKGSNRDVNMRNARAKLIVLAVVDEQGNRLFTDEDVKALGKKSAAAIERVFDVAMRLAGLSSSDVDELTENFDDGQSDDSTSD